VAPLPDFNSNSTPLQLLSFNPKVAGPLTATVARSGGGGTMNMNLPGLQASLQAGAHAGQVDHVTVDPHSDVIGYETSASRSPFGGTLLSAPGARASSSAAGTATMRSSAGAKRSLSDRIVQFHVVSSRGGGETVSFPEGHEFVLHHSGAPTSVSLTLSAFAANGQPIAVELPPVQVAGGEALVVVPANWRRLDSAPVRIMARRHGHRSVRVVRGRSVGKAFARVRKAALTALGGHHYRLDLPLRISHAPQQGRLSVAASLLLHGHPVARASANQLSGSLRHVRAVHLTLPKALKPGRYTVSLRLLEVTASGAAQGSVVVTKTLSARAR
jgi:hypothetical protein